MRWGIAIVVGGLGASAALAIAAGAFAKPDEPKPPPKPKLELRTASQQEALATRAIKVAVRSQARPTRCAARRPWSSTAFPRTYTFKLGPESKPLQATARRSSRSELSARQREVLEFAAQACDKATLAVEARAARLRPLNVTAAPGGAVSRASCGRLPRRELHRGRARALSRVEAGAARDPTATASAGSGTSAS